MDREQAKFILRSFRPSGDDANDPTFAHALELAMHDPELAKWLAEERLIDQEFAQVIGESNIPDGLREAVLDLAEQDELKFSEADAAFTQALGTLDPPEDLRNRLLALSETLPQLRDPEPEPATKGKIWQGPWIWFTGVGALAAVLALLLMIQVGQKGEGLSSTPGPSLASRAKLSPEDVRLAGIEFLTSDFQLATKSDEFPSLVSHLEAQQAPTPRTLPERILALKTLGCRTLEIHGHKASLICFQTGSGGPMAHLIILDLEDLQSDQIPENDRRTAECRRSPQTSWASTYWKHEQRAYFLFSTMEVEQMSALL